VKDLKNNNLLKTSHFYKWLVLNKLIMIYSQPRKENRMSKIKDHIIAYCGNRGIDRPIKRCAKYKDMFMIVFNDYPNDVEISFHSWVYECYDEISTKKMIWNKSNYEKLYKKYNKECEV